MLHALYQGRPLDVVHEAACLIGKTGGGSEKRHALPECARSVTLLIEGQKWGESMLHYPRGEIDAPVLQGLF